MLKIFKNNFKTIITVIISTITLLYQLLAVNAEILGVPNKTIMIISFVVTAITIIWNGITNGTGDTKTQRLMSYFKSKN